VTRYRKRLIQDHSSECQRIQKVLEDAGIKLDSVASDVLGVSGRLMLKALVAGERDPEVLAEMAKRRLRSKIPSYAKRCGTVLRASRPAHRGVVGASRVSRSGDRPSRRSGGRADGPFAWARDRLDTITGVGQKAAESIIAEIGVDMSVFPTAGTCVRGPGSARPTTSRGKAALLENQPG